MNLIQSQGGRDIKESPWVPLYTNRFFLGLYTNRNPLRSPTGIIYESFYHVGSTDALIDGQNVELSSRLTLIRRPGNTAGLAGILSGANFPDIANTFYSFHENNGTVRVFVDGANSVYLWTANAIVPIFTKSAGSGQTYFQGVGQSLYFGNGKDQQKWLDNGAGVAGNSLATITATALTGNVATITAINNFSVGQTVVVSGTANGSGVFNTTARVTAVHPGFFQFSLVNGNITSASDSGFASGTWNWQPAPPTTAPTISIVASGSAAIAWAANTVFSTMGLIVDAGGNAHQLVSVNALGTNTTQLGTTGNGEPAWNQTPGTTTLDNGITWTNFGPAALWTPNTTYNNFSAAGSGGTVANPCFVYDPASGALFGNTNAGLSTGVSGQQKPPFSAINGAEFDELGNGTVNWFCIFPPFSRWAPSTVYSTYGSVSGNLVGQGIIEPHGYPPANNQTIFVHVATVGGTSGTGGVAPKFATVAGQKTTDNQLVWLCLGSATWAGNTNYSAWSGTQPVFSTIKDSNGNMQVCTVAGKSKGTQPTWKTHYGDVTQDGTVSWSCVGPPVTWAANTQWYLPAVGFIPPISGAQPYGSAEVIGNGGTTVQAVVISGKSGGSAPAFSATIGNNTTDNGITWRNVAAFSQNSITWTRGYGYCIAYKARSPVDTYSIAALGGGGLAFGQPAGTAIISGTSGAAPTGSADGSVSTASPIAQMAVGPNSGSVVNLSGTGSPDPQIDTISIFRTLDGGATFFWLTDILNPQPIGGIAQSWKYQDFIPDNPTAAFPGTLNFLVLAPLAHASDPPPTGLINLTQHLGRVFGSVGSTVFCSEGPLVGGANQPPGNAYTAFNPGQYWTFTSPVSRNLPSNLGLIVFTASDVGLVSGGASITSQLPSPLIPGLGLTSYNALTTNGGIVYLVSADGQGLTIDSSLGVSEVGFPIGDKIANLNPASVYAAFHIQGSQDKALFLADGSTGWYRCNPNQAPDYAISGPVWSPKANIVGGIKAIASLEVSPGKHALVMGSASANQPLLVRDSTFKTFADNGVSYPANFTFGSMVLAHPGQLAETAFITCEFQKVGTSPKLAVLLDEISDTGGLFEDLSGFIYPATGLPPQDAPWIYGAVGESSTLYKNRFYFAQSINGQVPQPTMCRHMQVKMDFQNDTVENELLTLSVFGRYLQEM